MDHYLQDNTRIVVTDDGFVGIFNNSAEGVLDILNTIFATGITFGVGSAYGREKDLCKFTLIGNGTSIQLFELPNKTRVQSERNLFSFQRDNESTLDRWRQFKLHHRVIPIQAIKNVLDRSNDYLAIKDSKTSLHKDLLLALEGYGLYYEEAHKGAYLYGWTIIETIIDQIWKEYVDTLRISSDDREKLKESSQWTSYHHIEMLFALNKIDLTYRNLLTKLRRKRNDVIHKKKNVDVSSSQRKFTRFVVNNLPSSFWETDRHLYRLDPYAINDIQVFRDNQEKILKNLYTIRSNLFHSGAGIQVESAMYHRDGLISESNFLNAQRLLEGESIESVEMEPSPDVPLIPNYSLFEHIVHDCILHFLKVIG